MKCFKCNKDAENMYYTKPMCNEHFASANEKDIDQFANSYGANKPDPINPKHYQAHPSGVQCIDIIEHFPANIANVVKYCWRAGLKDGNSIIQDLEKAKWYIEREIGRQKKMEEK